MILNPKNCDTFDYAKYFYIKDWRMRWKKSVLKQEG